MKYAKPLKLYLELTKKNAGLWKPTECHRLLCLDICNRYVHLAVSNPDNTIAIPLRYDFCCAYDNLMISDYNLAGFIFRYPYKLIEGKGKLLAAEVENFVCAMCKTGQLRGLKYTYWDDCINTLDTDLVLNHHLEFICNHLNLPEDLSQDIMDKFYASRVLQGYIDGAKMMVEIDRGEDKLDN
ncbi:hypothetical protein EZV62_003255 [Acer yangbiense]|uniref:Uncharacterized protein n=1 Tax=Acer yangbiense TaxID=1000413 RepID=A0A5C7IG70_9ROSI|nr:hypothetical protein EZV62_003255 [Acer yangbiense]